MTLSKECVDTLSDLIENRLSTMHVGDRDDLREWIALERALSELRGPDKTRDTMIKKLGVIPHRGRHRKINAILGEERA